MAQVVIGETTHIRAAPTVRVSAIAGWGYFPILGFSWAVGLLGIALADFQARRDIPSAPTVFWIGYLFMLVPIIIRVVGRSTPRHERIALVVLLGLGLYVTKVFQSPVSFTLHDEFIHWQTADDILRTGRLFHENSQIPVSSLYPGLHIATIALMKLTGLDLFPAGVIVLGAARAMMMLALFMLYEQVSGSSRVAGIAALLYMGNTNFNYFMSQFSYESLALPLAAFVVAAAVARSRSRGQSHFVGLTLAVLLGVAATAVTHHLTSLALAGSLLVWPALVFIWRRVSPMVRLFARHVLAGHRPPNRLFGSITSWMRAVNNTVYGLQPGYALIAIFGLVVTLYWMLTVATPTVAYLGPVFRDGITGLSQFVSGQSSGRQLFQASTGQIVTPKWEQLTSVASVVLVVILIPVGLLRFWHYCRHNPFAFALAAAAVAFPVTMAFRFTSRGWEISNRSSEFLFIGIAFIVAIGIARHWPSTFRTLAWNAVCVVAITVICLGGFMTGWPSWARLPGPYLLEADARSVEPQGITAATWAASHIGTGNRMVTDRTNGLLMGSYGEQRIVTGVMDGVFVGGVYFSRDYGTNDEYLLQRGQGA